MSAHHLIQSNIRETGSSAWRLPPPYRHLESSNGEIQAILGATQQGMLPAEAESQRQETKKEARENEEKGRRYGSFRLSGGKAVTG